MTKLTATGVRVRGVLVGGNAPVVIQSMTNTSTADIEATTLQVMQLANAGSEIVRLTVNDATAAAAVPAIREALDSKNCSVPLVGDFHFNGHKLLTEYPECAQALSKYRINPGNVGKGKRRDIQFATMIEIACKYDKPVRIGVNWGSMDQALLARLMDENAKLSAPHDAHDVMLETVIRRIAGEPRTPTLDEIKDGLAGNLCSCGTYSRIFEAVQKTAERG